MLSQNNTRITRQRNKSTKETELRLQRNPQIQKYRYTYEYSIPGTVAYEYNV